MPILDNCAIIERGNPKYKCLFGEIYEDSRFEEGHHVRTSEIVELDEVKMIAKTESGTVYHLKRLMSVEDLRKKITMDYEDESYVSYLLNIISGIY